MIERIYLDNIRSFVNFKWQPGPVALILGDNGTGKTALLATLASVQQFLMGNVSTEEAFPDESRTRWQKDVPNQTVEIDLRTSLGVCRYRLVVEHDRRNPGKNRVLEERVTMDGQPLVDFALSKLQLYRDDGTKGADLFVKWTRSGVGAVYPSPDAQKLAAFKDVIQHMWLLRPDPRRMEARLNISGSADSGHWLNSDLSNFGDWFLKALQAQPMNVMSALREAGNALPGFVELHQSAGWLHARFERDGRSSVFRWDELSDGQRALIALYLLRYVAASPGALLAIDEPDNYVALAEIQPWLLQIEQIALKSGGPSIWLVSHHPEVLNLFAVDHGWRFFKDGPMGHTQVDRFRPIVDLSPAETIARGWDHDQGG